MKEYEYVTKKEYSPVRKEIEEEILKKVHKFLKHYYLFHNSAYPIEKTSSVDICK